MRQVVDSNVAFELDSELLEYGIQQRILVASPVTLLKLLRAAAFGWQQYHIAEHAREIADQGRELYTRFLNVIKPIADTGDKLGKAVDAYNQAIGAMESRLIPALGKSKDSAVVSEEPPTLEPLEQNPRLLPDVEE